MVDVANETVALGIAIAGLVTAAGNAVAAIIKARNDREVNRAVSSDLVKLADATPRVDAEHLETPKVTGNPPTNGDGLTGPVAG